MLMLKSMSVRNGRRIIIMNILTKYGLVLAHGVKELEEHLFE